VLQALTERMVLQVVDGEGIELICHFSDLGLSKN
jgi:hypothetical protein